MISPQCRGGLQTGGCTFFPVCIKRTIQVKRQSVLLQTATSAPSLKMTFLHQYNAPRLLHSTADYDCQNCFEHFRSLLNLKINNLLEKQLLYDLLFCHYTGCSPCDIGIVEIHGSLATSWNKSGVYRLCSSGNIANKVTIKNVSTIS